MIKLNSANAEMEKKTFLFREQHSSLCSFLKVIAVLKKRIDFNSLMFVINDIQKTSFTMFLLVKIKAKIH